MTRSWTCGGTWFGRKCPNDVSGKVERSRYLQRILPPSKLLQKLLGTKKWWSGYAITLLQLPVLPWWWMVFLNTWKIYALEAAPKTNKKCWIKIRRKEYMTITIFDGIYQMDLQASLVSQLPVCIAHVMAQPFYFPLFFGCSIVILFHLLLCRWCVISVLCLLMFFLVSVCVNFQLSPFLCCPTIASKRFWGNQGSVACGSPTL